MRNSNFLLHFCLKSQFADILEVELSALPDTYPETYIIIMDAYSLVNTFPQRKSKIFQDYALLEVLPTVETYSSKYRRTAAEGRRALLIKANDTDILVIAVSTLPMFPELGLQELWVP